MNKDEKIKELENKLTAIKDEIEELKDHKFPQLDSKYYYIGSRNHIANTTFEDDIFDTAAKKIGNFFETREEAQKELDKRILLQELKEFADYKPDWEDLEYKYYIFYEHMDKKLSVGLTQHYHRMGEIYFSTREKAEEALEHFGDRLKVLF